MDWWGRETTSTAGPKRRVQADSQLGNASKPDLKTDGKQSSHSCTVTYRSIEVITCSPGTSGCGRETAHDNI